MARQRKRIRTAAATVCALIIFAAAGCGSSGDSYCAIARRTEKDKILEHLGDAEHPASVVAGYRKADTAARRLAAKAPPPVKADMQRVAAALHDLAQQVERQKGNLTEIDASRFNADDIEAATDRVDAYNQQACAINGS
jgi:hypothetical protein